MSQMKQEIIVIWITFFQSACRDKVLSYKATEFFMEHKGRTVWRKALFARAAAEKKNLKTKLKSLQYTDESRLIINIWCYQYHI